MKKKINKIGSFALCNNNQLGLILYETQVVAKRTNKPYTLYHGICLSPQEKYGNNWQSKDPKFLNKSQFVKLWKNAMKNKISKNKQSKKNSVTHQSLVVLKQIILNLEQQIKELSKRVEQLQYSQPYYPPNKPQQPSQPNPWFKPAWPNTDQPIIWENTSTMSKEQHAKTHYEKVK